MTMEKAELLAVPQSFAQARIRGRSKGPTVLDNDEYDDRDE